MAIITVSNSGGNWNATASWVGGVVPVSGDSINCTLTSGNLTVNINTPSLTGIDFTNYVNQLTINAIINLNNGSITLSATMMPIIANSSAILRHTSSGIFTSNGIELPCMLQLYPAAGTRTFADNWSVEDFTIQSGVGTICTGNTVYVYGDFSSSTCSGSTNIVLQPRIGTTKTWTGNNTTWIQNSVTLNGLGSISIGSNVYANNITYLSLASVTHTGTLFISGSSNLNTNGIIWVNITLSNSTTLVNSSLLTLSGSLTTNGGITTLNGSNIHVGGNLNINQNNSVVGSSKIVMTGTGIIKSQNTNTCLLKCDLEINTPGVITFSNLVPFQYNTGTLTYTAGTVNTTGSTLNLTSGSTLNTNGINWNNVSYSASTYTITLLSNFNITGTLTLPTNSFITHTTANSSLVNLASLTIGQNSTLSGNSKTVFKYGGTWTHTNSYFLSVGSLRTNTDIDTGIQTLNFGSSVGYGGTLKYVSGTVNTGTCVVYINTLSTILDVNGSSSSTATTLSNTGVNFYNLYAGVTVTITLNSPICVVSNLTINAANINDSTGTSGASTYLVGNLYIPYIGSGSSKIIFNGLGSQSWTHNSSSTVPSNSYGATYHYIINKSSGILTFGAQIGLGGGSILDWIQGTVDTTTNSSTLYIWTNCTLNTNGINWNNIVITNATITNNSLLTCNSLTLGGTIYPYSNNVTFSGTSGFTTGTLSVTTPGRTITLASGKTYNVTSGLNLVGSTASRITIRSLTTPRAVFTLPYGASQNVKDTNATNIDSSLGQTIRSSFGVLSNTVNWELGQGSWITMMKPQYHE